MVTIEFTDSQIEHQEMRPQDMQQTFQSYIGPRLHVIIGPMYD